MLIPRQNRLAIYTHLFREGVLAVKKDMFAPKHQQIDVPNLHVMKLMVELKSKGVITEVFSWQWHYFTLTEEGIVYLRQYLHLSEETVPNTHKKSDKPASVPSFAQNQNRDRDAFTGRRGGAASRGSDFNGGRPRRQEKTE